MSKVCPYYKGGYCTSSLLEQPSQDFVSSQRCLTENYKTCRFYIPKEEEKEGVEKYIEGTNEILLYAKVNILDELLISECEYYELIKTDKGYIAKCKLMNRVITKSQAKLCISYWNTCPIRKTVKE